MEQQSKNNVECCFSVQKSHEFGRCLIASRDIPALSVILRETPIVYSPGESDGEYETDDENSDVETCLGCCTQMIHTSGHRCSKCGWPVCNEACEKLTVHAENECSLFSQGSIPHVPSQLTSFHKSLLVLRCLLLIQRSPQTWKTIFSTFEDHNDLRSLKSRCVEEDNLLCENIKWYMGHTSWNDEVRCKAIKLSGIINVNAFCAINYQNYEKRITQCIFGTARLLANSCAPNCTWRIGPAPGFEIIVRTSTPIRKGEMMSIMYCPQEILLGTLQRQVCNEDVSHFTCACERCKDPTELQTFLSAIRCPSCTGYLLPMNPLVTSSVWTCNSKDCDESQTVQKVVAQVIKMENKFKDVKREERLNSETKIEELERLLSFGTTILHPNHYVLQQIRLCIVKKQIPFITSMKKSKVEGLLDHVRNLNNVVDILAPGISQLRAMLQYFLVLLLSAQFPSLERSELKNEVADDVKNCIVQLAHNALLFFKHHNYHFEHNVIIKNLELMENEGK